MADIQNISKIDPNTISYDTVIPQIPEQRVTSTYDYGSLLAKKNELQKSIDNFNKSTNAQLDILNGQMDDIDNLIAGANQAGVGVLGVSIITPSKNEVVSGNYNVSASVYWSSNDTVKFLLDGVTINSNLTVPYIFLWDSASVSNGSHTLSAVVTDSHGNNANSENITFTVNN